MRNCFSEKQGLSKKQCFSVFQVDKPSLSKNNSVYPVFQNDEIVEKLCFSLDKHCFTIEKQSLSQTKVLIALLSKCACFLFSISFFSIDARVCSIVLRQIYLLRKATKLISEINVAQISIFTNLIGFHFNGDSFLQEYYEIFSSSHLNRLLS